MCAAVALPETVQTIPESLAFWAERTPHQPAIVVPGRAVITYADLWREVHAFAACLSRLGIGRADRVVLVLPEGPALAVALLGTMTAAIAAPLTATMSTTPRELGEALSGLRAAVAIGWAPLPDALMTCCRQYGVPVIVLTADAPSHALHLAGQAIAAPSPLTSPVSRDVAVLRQTSGTTGRPKRMARTHGDLTGFGRDQHEKFGLGTGDRTLAIAPMTATLGQAVLVHAVACGAALVFPRSPDIAAVWDAIVQEGATWLSVSAGFLEVLARFLEARPGRAEELALRYVQVTAAPISAAVCDALAKRLGAPILPRYSSSEAGGIALTLPPPAPSRPGSAGQPIQEVRIVDETGTPRPVGETGEIWVRGPRVVPGYLDDPAATTAAFLPDGWYRTGDAGYRDEEGFLFVTGRLDELINRGGDKIAPAEVDAVLLAHPAVREAAVFAVPDARLGADVVAAVVLERGEAVTPRELRHWMLGRLTPSKVPRRIWFLDELPRTVSGKVQRKVLAERFAWQSDC